MSNIAISCKNITKTYPMYNNPKDRFKEALHPFRKLYRKDFYALNDVSFDVYKGETVGIIGQNGAGKSTLLKIITGVLTASSGTTEINGIVSSILELGTGFNMELTGIENVYVNCSLMGLSKEDVDLKLDRIIAFADIGEHINQPVRGYSSGMFARLAMAVAISVEPDILIVDEALAVGDITFQTKCMTAMKNIQDKGTTILFVSHDINSVKSLCERCVYIKNGNLHAVGVAGEIAELYMNDMRMLTNKENEQVQKLSDIEPKREEGAEASQRLDEPEPEPKPESESEFDKRVEFFRHGTGEAKITNVEIVDENGSLVEDVEFNQKVTIRIYFESYVNKKISVNFHILDDKKINIATCNFLQAGQELYDVKAGDSVIVEYSMKLPIQHNTYSVIAMVTDPIIPDVNISYLDVVPDSYIFRMGKRPNSVLWSKVDLFPELRVETK
ncbi:ABC transporter ATP-binding protein [Vibrio splendidus]|uniref:ABC transporter ATP-binding protein n=1 Tax=Vibrio splendidus TaxID=29497 RepID=UPI001C11B5B8|nr:ABC transporter ATP-binding protein [Vibrio splendidus]